MTKLGYLHFTNAPTEDTMRALPDVDAPTNERCLTTVVLFHDESTFMANEDQPTQWGIKGKKMMSDFIDEHNGFLALSNENMNQPKHQSRTFENMHVSSWSMEREGGILDKRQVYCTDASSN